MKTRDLSVRAVGALCAAALVVGANPTAAADGDAVNATAAPAPAGALPRSFADIVERVAPAVVSIDIEARTEAESAVLQRTPDGSDGPFGDLSPFFRERPARPARGTGSGFFISSDGYILTNNHVIEKAEKITVRTFDERTLTATLVGRDAATDLAVIKVDVADHPFVDFDERATPRVGDWVVAVGNPFNLGGTATAGIVSALRRPRVSGSSYVDYIQIDAAINRGNSGGPTFDVHGRLVGVNTAIFSPSGGSIGIGFDIPAEVAATVARELMDEGKVSRGYIGAQVQDITPAIAESLGVKPRSGALVADVMRDGPGDRAGLMSGDVVLKVNGRSVTSAADLTRQVGEVREGEDLRLEVRRSGALKTLVVRSGLRPPEDVLAGGGRPDPSVDMSRELGLLVTPRRGGGLAIKGVSPGSDAARKGLRSGDVIVQVNGKAADAPADVKAQVAAARADGRKNVLLLVSRDGRRTYLPLAIVPAEG